MILDQPPHLILPEHWQAQRPAIIRPVGVELRRAMPVMPGALIRRTKPGEAVYTYGNIPAPVAATTKTWSGVSYGTPAADRILLAFPTIFASTNAAAVINSVTVDGVAMTQQAPSSSYGQHKTFLYTLPLPAGTSGTIVATTSLSVPYWGLGLYAAYGVDAVPTSSTELKGDGTAGTLYVEPGGFIIGAMSGRGAQTAILGATSWTGLNPDGPQPIGATTHVMRTAHASLESAAGGNVSISCTMTNYYTQTNLCVAFR